MSHAPRGGSGADGDLISRQSKATSSSSDGRWPEPPAARARSPPGVQLLALARVSSAHPHREGGWGVRRQAIIAR